MDARTRLQAEFAREAAENEAALLLRLLRARARELTLGDLLALLDNSAGSRLLDRRVDELFLAGDPPPAPRPAPAAAEPALGATLAAIERADGPRTARELAELAGEPLERCEEELRALVTVGLVELVRDDPQPRYRIAAGQSYRPTVLVLALAAVILTILKRSGRRMQLMDLRRATGCSEERVRRAVQHLKRIRAITTTGQNSGTRYGLVDTPTHGPH